MVAAVETQKKRQAKRLGDIDAAVSAAVGSPKPKAAPAAKTKPARKKTKKRTPRQDALVRKNNRAVANKQAAEFAANKKAREDFLKNN